MSRSSASNRSSDCADGGPRRSASGRRASVGGVNVGGGGALAVTRVGPGGREMYSDCSIFAVIMKAS